VSPWRRITTRIAEADDVVAVDGDTEASTLVFTRDEEPAGCDGPAAPSVHALRLPRSAAREQSFELAPAACDREVGPFWTGTVRKGFVVAWVERASARLPTQAPITGLAYRIVTASGPGELRRVALASDDIVDAGCDLERCYAVALARPAGASEERAEAVQVIAYP
jgi:hypothetical protein